MGRLLPSMIAMVLFTASGAMAATAPPGPPVAAPAPVAAGGGDDLEGLPILPPQDVDYRYLAEGKRDPFTAPLEEVKKEEKVATPTGEEVEQREREPLESFNLESLKLVGIMRISGKMAALIQDPNGVAYSLQTGHYLGTHEGRITTIQENHVELVEQAPTPIDKNATRTTILTLHEESE